MEFLSNCLKNIKKGKLPEKKHWKIILLMSKINKVAIIVKTFQNCKKLLLKILDFNLFWHEMYLKLAYQ